MKIEVDREVLYQMAVASGGVAHKTGELVSAATREKIASAARRIAEAAAIPEGGPIEIVAV